MLRLGVECWVAVCTRASRNRDRLSVVQTIASTATKSNQCGGGGSKFRVLINYITLWGQPTTGTTTSSTVAVVNLIV